jgi:hypothetical protein
MFRFVGGLVLPLTLAVLLTAAAGRSAAQYPCAAPPPVVYSPPTVAYYAPPAVSYYAPPVVSYYAPPVVSYYSAPVVSYYAPATAYPAASVTTRYGLFGRPRATVVRYYGP